MEGVLPESRAAAEDPPMWTLISNSRSSSARSTAIRLSIKCCIRSINNIVSSSSGSRIRFSCINDSIICMEECEKAVVSIHIWKDSHLSEKKSDRNLGSSINSGLHLKRVTDMVMYMSIVPLNYHWQQKEHWSRYCLGENHSIFNEGWNT